MQTARISCVVPTLNSAATLDTTLLSLRTQKNEPVNIVVVDSGSTDSTLEICRRWDVPVVYAPPGNMYQAINVGLRQCETEWVTYLNSDDWVYTDSYHRLIERGIATRADFVYGNHDFVDEQGRFMCSMGTIQPKHILGLFRAGELGFIQPAVIYRREIYQQLQGFDEAYRLCADGDFFIRGALGGARFARLAGSPVVAFRMHQKQQTQAKWDQLTAEKRRIASSLVTAPSAGDRLLLLRYRLLNLPYYGIRLKRLSLLARGFRFRLVE